MGKDKIFLYINNIDYPLLKQTKQDENIHTNHRTTYFELPLNWFQHKKFNWHLFGLGIKISRFYTHVSPPMSLIGVFIKPKYTAYLFWVSITFGFLGSFRNQGFGAQALSIIKKSHAFLTGLQPGWWSPGWSPNLKPWFRKGL